MQTGAEGERDRFETTVLVVVWVLPLLATAGLLVWIGLAWLAGALLVVEAVAGALVLLVRRRPQRAPTPGQRPWLVPLAMVGVLLALVVVTLVVVELS